MENVVHVQEVERVLGAAVAAYRCDLRPFFRTPVSMHTLTTDRRVSSHHWLRSAHSLLRHRCHRIDSAVPHICVLMGVCDAAPLVSHVQIKEWTSVEVHWDSRHRLFNPEAPFRNCFILSFVIAIILAHDPAEKRNSLRGSHTSYDNLINCVIQLNNYLKPRQQKRF